jgi:capsular polysaccharide biosynthesis protein
VKWHETNYQAYAQHLEQNRIDQALEAGRISSINIIQPATFEPKPVGPKVLVILGLGLVIGLIGAIGLPLVADGLDLPLANPQEVENHLGVGVLGSVPRFQAEQLSGNGKT